MRLGSEAAHQALIKPGVRTMLQFRISIATFVCLFAVVAAAPAGSQPARGRGACGQITAACQKAGFTPGTGRQGTGLMADCVMPIMQGREPPPLATKPLPQIDPKLVADCKTSNPRFGQGRAAPGGAPAQPPASPPPNEIAPNPPAPNENAPGPQPQASGRQGKRPNIVFVLTDDLAMNLVQYMPHVLEMQKTGVTFAHYFVTDSLCCPSRSSIFTGRFPHDTGIFRNTGNDGGFLAFHDRHHEQSTFATALAAAGYRTAMLGKYLNGYQPRVHPPEPGWTLWAVAGNGYPGFNYDLNQDGKVVHYGNQPADYMTDVLSSIAVGFIKQSAGTPFVIEIATFAPHAPYTPAPRDADAFPGLVAPRTPAFNVPHDPNEPLWLRKHNAIGPPGIAVIDRDFRKRAQSVQAVDKMIGELQAAVAAIGEESNTYFVFSSDNGYHMGEFRLMPGKMTAYDTDINVPLIVTGPGVPSGRTVEEITENIDLNPTFTAIGGAATAANVDGLSLMPLLHGQAPADWRKAALIEHHGPVRNLADPDFPDIRSGNPTSYEAIRSPTWLYVEYADGDKEYHDLATDPDEVHNTFAALPNEQKNSLHAMLAALQDCHDAQSCSAADRSTHAAAP
jgi:N-acetylglucosamine-6-sulfatase